jgi:hypothetical protein
MTERGAKDDVPGKWLDTARMAMGIAQGITLYLLYQADRTGTWPATAPPVFAATTLLGLFVPLLLLDGLGHLRRRTLLAWTLAAAAVLAGLAVHDITRRGGGSRAALRHVLSPVLVASAAVALFIAHNLLTAADAARRPLAAYAAYFDAAWRTGLQLALSAAFLGVFWGLLVLGAALFGLIGIDALWRLIERDGFRFLASATVFAAGVHLTDVKPGLTRGMRGVALMLLSWLLPVMAPIAVGFLVALPFTGLDPLWATRNATAVLLAAVAALVVLINTAHQDGETPPPRPVRLAARAVALARTRPERGDRQVARDLTPEERAARITVHPAGQSLPESFLHHGLAGGGSDGGLPCLRGTGHCDAFLIDMDGDGAPEIVLAGIGWIAVLRNTAEDRWVFAGNLPLGRCAGVVEALRQGRFALVAPTWRDLEVDGRRLRFRAEEAC